MEPLDLETAPDPSLYTVTASDKFCSGCRALDLARLYWEGENKGLDLNDHAGFESYESLKRSAQSCHFCNLVLEGYNRNGCHLLQDAGQSKPSCPHIWESDIDHSEKWELKTLISMTYTDYDQQCWYRVGIRLGKRGVSIVMGLSEDTTVYPSWMLARRKQENVMPGILRPVQDDPKNDSMFARIRTWVHRCDRHPVCKSDPRVVMPTRLVHIGTRDTPVLRLCVNAEGQDHRIDGEMAYVALSYCWGKTHGLCTTTETVESLKSGIDEETLPATIKDAIFVGRQIGIQYLWVDRLCILQDSTDDWEKQSRLMGAIYRGAYITISASVAPGVEHGFLHKRMVPPTVACGMIHRDTDESDAVDGRIYAALSSNPSFRSANYAMEIFTNEPLFRRGWALQERLLSRMVLHFCWGQLVWQCLRCIESESGEFQVSRSWDLDIARQLERMMNLETWLDTPNHYMCWHQLVELYSKCELSLTKDRLPALAGIAQRLNPFLEDAYLAGHWRSHMPDTLLWRIKQPRKRESITNTTNRSSWSWISAFESVEMAWISQGKPLATIISTDVQIKSRNNEYGEVTSGSLKISAPLVQIIRLGSNGEDDGDDDCWTVAGLNNVALSGRMYTDNEEQPEQVYLLAVARSSSFNNCLLVTPREDAAKGIFERVGIMQWNRFQYVLPPPSEITLV